MLGGWEPSRGKPASPETFSITCAVFLTHYYYPVLVFLVLHICGGEGDPFALLPFHSFCDAHCRSIALHSVLATHSRDLGCHAAFLALHLSLSLPRLSRLTDTLCPRVPRIVACLHQDPSSPVCRPRGGKLACVLLSCPFSGCRSPRLFLLSAVLSVFHADYVYSCTQSTDQRMFRPHANVVCCAFYHSVHRVMGARKSCCSFGLELVLFNPISLTALKSSALDTDISLRRGLHSVLIVPLFVSRVAFYRPT